MSTQTIDTEFRTIRSPIPHPDSQPILDALAAEEPRSIAGFSPVVWDHAQGFQVHDAHGNKWIDLTSAIILANAGHSHPHIAQAIKDQLDTGLWQHYINPAAMRLKLTRALRDILPDHLERVLFLTTGSEAVECAIKLMRLHGQSIHPDKIHILSFHNAFHGRTMAAQMAGGFDDQKNWMGLRPAGFHHIPFPDCNRCPWGKPNYQHCGRECLERGLQSLRDRNIDEDKIAGVITETFQGPTVSFMPPDFLDALTQWAAPRDILLTFDEIQAGFGRTGKWFAFEHFNVQPDIVALGKGMTSSLPMSAVAARRSIMDLAGPSDMSSTHTGNPLCAAAVIANIEVLRDEHLVDHAAQMESVLRDALADLQQRFPHVIRSVVGKGLAWAIDLSGPVESPTLPDLDKHIAARCRELGVLIIPTGRRTLKIAPPLCITEPALLEAVTVIAQALEEQTAAL